MSDESEIPVKEREVGKRMMLERGVGYELLQLSTYSS